MLKKSLKQFSLLFLSLAVFVGATSVKAASEEVEIEYANMLCAVCHKGAEARNPIFSVCAASDGTPEFRHGSHQECAHEWECGLWPDSNDALTSGCPQCPRRLITTFDTIIALASDNERPFERQEEHLILCGICDMPAAPDSPLISVCTTPEGLPGYTHGCHAHCILARKESYDNDDKRLACPGCHNIATIHFGVIIAQIEPQNAYRAPKAPIVPPAPPAHAQIEPAAEEAQESQEINNCPGCHNKVNTGSIDVLCNKNRDHMFECHPLCKNSVRNCPAQNCDGKLSMSCNICWDNKNPRELLAPCEEAMHVFCKTCLVEYTTTKREGMLRTAAVNGDVGMIGRIQLGQILAGCPMCRRLIFENRRMDWCSECGYAFPEELLSNRNCGSCA